MKVYGVVIGDETTWLPNKSRWDIIDEMIQDGMAEPFDYEIVEKEVINEPIAA